MWCCGCVYHCEWSFGTTGKTGVFHNFAVFILDRMRCSNGGGANSTMYCVLMVDYHMHVKQDFWLIGRVQRGFVIWFLLFWCECCDRWTSVWCIVYPMFVQKPIHNSFNDGVMNHILFTKSFIKLISCRSIQFCLQLTPYYAHTQFLWKQHGEHITLTHPETLLLEKLVFFKCWNCIHISV